ncbi:phage tail assembly protein [Pectobacterium carotovorum]|uniref:Phage tail assembly protein n=1 Tax=Pectobacterium versatile TaxID=2488639 RepID=A0ABU8K392_9GAMM|nr:MULTISPECIES: phage tail assembly protein [Pectobacterium]MBN3238302.1 phage tail assembly protein [Pectobacterium versatile]MBQ4761504.1 phage tail assembly protein [Pectobacterium versatile]MBQ4775255.1 phage tail assembly protein [Pectobacterium versatile]MBQ4781309.1 phage tail assembly protein [Pectobacterium versatile]MBQ4785865.1 phage tail assembly protein [Pectobacterium versatile]
MNKNDNVVTLETPIKRGETVIDTITLIKPTTGTLRGVSLAALAGSDVDAMIKVLPRMTLPALTETEIARMELPDMITIAGKVIGFLTPKSQQADYPEA